MQLFDQMFRTEEIVRLFSDRACVQGMLDFESALAKAEAIAGVIPSSAVAAIATSCKAEFFNVEHLSRSAKSAGNVAIPLIKELTALVAKSDKDAARYVHWGATSQDAIDTGFLLQLKPALALIEADLTRLARALAGLAAKHRSTPVAGRTWMQQALPTTFGAIAAGWLDAIQRHRARVREMCPRVLVLQFGGAVGTLAALGGRGQQVAAALARELQLGLPAISWHSHRDRMAEVATTLGLCVGTLGKIARDIALGMQTEVAEIFEPAAEGRGGSSTMPQKRNPVAAAAILSAATRMPGLVATMLTAMVQEQQRGLGGWHTEWETLPEIVALSAGALRNTVETIPLLEIDSERMRANLELTHGLIYAERVSMVLAEKVGKQQAHHLVQAASRQAQKEKRHLLEVLLHDAEAKQHLTPNDLDRLFDVRNALGLAETFVDMVLAEHLKSEADTHALR